MADLVPPLHYADEITNNQLRAYADDRGFAQLTIERYDGVLGSVRISGEQLRHLVAQLSIAADAQREVGERRHRDLDATTYGDTREQIRRQRFIVAELAREAEPERIEGAWRG